MSAVIMVAGVCIIGVLVLIAGLGLAELINDYIRFR